MIRYALACDSGHSFDSWFQNAGAFDSLTAAGMVSCAVCGSSEVSKTVMAPAVPARRETAPDLSRDRGHPLEKMRRHLEANSDYVGPRFAAEARSMHLGETPHRPIWGEANGAEAKSLIEDGVPVLPLPMIPRRQTN